MATLRRLRLPLLALATALSVWVAMIAAPVKPYVRWQAFRTEAYARLGWIYERVHFDPTPIDVAFIGTSHTLNGINASQIAGVLAEENLRNSDGRCVTATNFAVPEYGRNLHWLIARELLTARPVKVMVIEVLENETRKAHTVFAQVASARDVIAAPMLINQNYIHDLIRLPYRQATLAFKGFWPSQFAIKSNFDPRDYDGSDIDNTLYVQVSGVRITRRRDTVLDPATLQREAASLNSAKNLHMLPTSLQAWEYKVPNVYVRAMLDLARARGTQVVFLYLPGYGRPAEPYDMSRYRGRGELLNVNAILGDPRVWLDVHHLNAAGASKVSTLVGAQLARLLSADTHRWSRAPALAAGPCRNGLPASHLKR